MILVECAYTNKLFLIPEKQILHIESATSKDVMEYCTRHNITDEKEIEMLEDSTKAVVTLSYTCNNKKILITNYVGDLYKSHM